MMAKEQIKESWDWGLYPEAERFVRRQIAWFLDRHPVAEELAQQIEHQTSTQFLDWIDHLVIPEERIETDDLMGLGFSEDKAATADDARVFRHPASTLLPVLLAAGNRAELVLRPEEIGEFAGALGIRTGIEGERYAPLRKVAVSRRNGLLLSAVERRGTFSFTPEGENGDGYEQVLGVLADRRRRFVSDAEGMEHCAAVVADCADLLPASRLADAFFRVERRYWETRNAAAKRQKERQDRFGLGWGNHDHHTFRSSREQFRTLIAIFEMMGLRPRERFHAGAEAGWGALVLEQPDAGTVVFADVDLTEEENRGDFAHAKLPAGRNRGTVGLWVALHGESILRAGMHHLAARLRFDTAQNDLAQLGFRVMQPFSYFPFLKQAFTEAELWKVDAERAAALVDRGILSSRQAMGFMGSGALGSHLENIQRAQGFRGFNQTSVSAIIRATDPRGRGGLYA